MNIYQKLNQATSYIEEHLEDEIKYDELAKILNVNTYTMQRLFSVLTGIPLAAYIRQRRLSNAACDLLMKNWRIIDIANKYGYDSSIAFSRAFTNFHGIKPSQVQPGQKLKNFSRIIFDEKIDQTPHAEYSVIDQPSLTLYGLHVKTDNEHIGQDAPNFFEQIERQNYQKYGPVNFGMVGYRDSERFFCNAYCVLYEQEISEFEIIKIPASKWLKFIIPSRKSKAIQQASTDFYINFLPSSNYQLSDLPELEYYHDGITEFWVPLTSD